MAWLLSAIVPYRDAPQPLADPGRKLPPPVAANIAREGFKATNKVSEIIIASIRNNQEITQLMRKLSEQRRRPHRQIEGEDPSARDVIGMAIRRWGPTWTSQTMFALLVNVADEPEAAKSKSDLSTHPPLHMLTVLAHLADFELFLKHVKELDLLEAYSMKPLLDGKTLAKELSTKPGPWMKDALDIVMAWQLRNPDKKSPEEAIQEVAKNRQMHGELTASLITHFLRLTIRPLFLKTQPSTVTAQGRKVTTASLPRGTNTDQPDEISKPWKGKDAYALDILRWIVDSLDDRTTETNWPLLVPPLLSILDDTDTQYKVQGCRLISTLLDRTPPALLTRTGLSEVFEQAIMPFLGYLPSLEPEDTSVALLSGAYPALISLSRAMKDHGEGRTTKRQIELLDRVIRKGILTAFANCPEHVRIHEVLLRNLCLINRELGIESVKHVKHVLPMLSEILGDPVGHAYPSTLLAAVEALQSVILNGWPRMTANRGEVLRGITLCWIHAQDEKLEVMEDLRSRLKATALMLRDAVGPECDIQADYRVLVEADPRLGGLLATEP